MWPHLSKDLDLFRHLLGQMKPQWRDVGMKLLSLVHTNQTHSEGKMIPTLGLFFVFEKGLLKDSDPRSIKLSEEEKTPPVIEVQCQIMSGCLRSWCYGLIEVLQPSKSMDEPQDLLHTKTSGRSSQSLVEFLQDSRAALHSRVHFMHRYVYEFLSLPGTWDCTCIS